MEDFLLSESNLQLILGLIVIFVILLITLVIIRGIKLFKKNNISSWKFLIPIYNLVIVSFLAKKDYKKSVGYIVGIWILPVMFVPLLTFSDK